MRQTMTVEARPDEDKTTGYNASAQPPGWFDRLLQPWYAILPLPKTPEGTILASQPPGIGGMSVYCGISGRDPTTAKATG
jgi:hypothetical protein